MAVAPPFAVVVLAAGGGTRMKSARPKVLHEVAGRSLVGHVLTACRPLQPEHLVAVIGHGREQVAEHLADVAPDAVIAVQHEQKGTGHAVRVTLEQLAEQGIVPDEDSGPILVLTGDTPLLTHATLDHLLQRNEETGSAATVLTAILDDAAGYGRVVRDDLGDVTAIVEHKDADETVLAITEVNSGMYAFSAAVLNRYLQQLTTDNAQGEEYLTDVIGHARADGLRVTAVPARDPNEILGVNDRAQLAQSGAILRERINAGWLKAGVTMVDPARVYIDSDVELAPDVLLEPGVALRGATVVAGGAVIGPDTTLVDTEVGAGASIRRTEATLAIIGENAQVGPFTYLRPGTRLAEGAKVGGFCEVKNAEIGVGSKVPHLSYVGDAEIGTGSNIGAASVFVNYDGLAKHRTVVGDHVRVGSDTMLVAPVALGDGSYTAAGSVVTDDVPPGALAVGRGRQRNIEGWVAKRRPGSAAAEAAAAVNRSGDEPAR
jgi:bifunctional UDP-N-acetylglucosamine pyrophosphorylase/glucosamine-1-phosphate N-acetyltransferase